MEAKTGADAWDVSGFRAFIDDAFRNFISKDAKSLIIDLRGNPGGDSLFSDVMVAWIADRPFRFYSRFKVRVTPEAIAANDKRIAEATRLQPGLCRSNTANCMRARSPATSSISKCRSLRRDPRISAFAARSTR